MKKSILKIEGIQILSKENQRRITGAAAPDISKCGCDCTGNVTGPFYCHFLIACPQVITC